MDAVPGTTDPDGIEPVECLFVTTLAVTTVADAERIVTWYRYHWWIERLRFTWKTVSGWNGRSRGIPLSHGGSWG